MFSKIFLLVTLAAVAVANSGNVVSSCKANNVVSNKCKCVKTIVRPFPVRSVVCKNTERRALQSYVRPVLQTVRYTVNPPLNCGPSIGNNVEYGIGSLGLGPNVYGSGLSANSYSALIGNNYGTCGGSFGGYGSTLISGNNCGAVLGNSYGSSLIAGNGYCGNSFGGCANCAGNGYNGNNFGGCANCAGNAYYGSSIISGKPCGFGGSYTV